MDYCINGDCICEKSMYFCTKKIVYYLTIIFLLIGSITGFSQDQKNVVLLDHWTDTTIEKGSEEAVFNDVWGFTIKKEDYCVIGSSIGTHFFKIENQKLNYLNFQAGKYQNKHVVHRDYKTYKNYLYSVCDEGTSSLQIFDLSYLPDSTHKVYDSDAYFQICHNIFIDSLNAKLYACGPNNTGMKIFDISNPILPVLIHEFAEVGYVHDCYVRDDTAFLNCGFDGLHIYNFSSSTPVQLGILDFYPNQGYNHSGWLSPDGNKYFFIDETEGTKVKLCEWNESLASIEITGTFGTNAYQNNVPHNIITLDNLAFVSYYNEGLRIFNHSNSSIQEIGIYDTFGKDTKYKLNGAWGVFVREKQNQILIADRQNGLFLFSFPIAILNSENQGTFITSTPLLDENSVLIPREVFQEDELKFSIFTLQGKQIYFQENFLNYVNIPLDIAAGTYVFSIYNRFDDLIETGKFVKGN